MDTGSPLPVPSGPPPVWAENRQALCDALPYFKSHESSLYTSLRMAKGFLVNQEITVRDMMNAEVIITTLGGGRSRDINGNMIRQNQGPPLFFNACFAAMRMEMPLGVILGKKYPRPPVQLDHHYNVLDFFTITDIWSEKDTSTGADITIWKIRLEKTDRSTKSWWQPKDKAHIVGSRACPAHSAQCSSCAEVSKQMFSQGWTCLNAECVDALAFPAHVDIQELSFASLHAAPLAWCAECRQGSKTIFSCGWACLNAECMAYFKFPDGVNLEDLKYSADFLQERTDFPALAQQLRPDVPDLKIETAQGVLGTQKRMREGLVCPKCHCCSRRKYWTHWAYENPVCDFVLEARPQPYPLDLVHSEENKENKKRPFKEGSVDNTILKSTETVNGYTVQQYLLPDPAKDRPVILGSITIFRATRQVNAEAGGADAIWNALQTDTIEDFGLQRHPAVHAGLPSEKLTRNFLQNWGAPYKFVVAVSSKPFKEAPESLIGALKRMRWAGRVAVDGTNASFKHPTTDGSVVIPCDTLAKDFVDFNELLSLGYMQDDKISYHDDGEDTLGPTVATMSLGSPAQMSLKTKSRYSGKDKVVLRFPLYHGDLIVMHGTHIHKAYLHKVDPKGQRRFALTCRNIVLEKLDPETRVDAIQNSIIPLVPGIWNYPKPYTPTGGTKRPNDEAAARSTKRHKSEV